MKIIILTPAEIGKRQLKVYSRMRPKGSAYQQLPEIRIMGKWLEKIGFKCGDSITLIQSENRIVITLNEKRIVRL